MSVAALCLFACEWAVVVLGLYIAANSLAPMISDGNMAHRYFGAVLVPAVLTSVLLYALGLYDQQQLRDFRGSLPRLAAFLLIFAPMVALSLSISQIGNTDASAARYASWTTALCASILI